MSADTDDKEWCEQRGESERQWQAVHRIHKPGDTTVPREFLNNPKCDVCHKEFHWFIVRDGSTATLCAECAA